MDDCDSVVKLIWDWLDDELDEATWKEIEAHLAGCTGCTEHVEFARGFLKKVHETPAPAGDLDALRERVRASLRG
jgi:anti-sigma factor RsiW